MEPVSYTHLSDNEEIDLDACLDDDDDVPSQELIDTMQGDEGFTAENNDDMLLDSVDDDEEEDDDEDYGYGDDYYPDDEEPEEEPKAASDILTADDF